MASFTFNWRSQLFNRAHLAETIPFLDVFLSKPGSVKIPDAEAEYK